MADITLTSNSGILQFRTRTGSPRIQTFDASTAASTALIRVGQVVQFDILTETASHRLIRTSTAAGHPNLTTNVAGIALGSDTSDGSTHAGNGTKPISVVLADGETEFLFPSKVVTASTLVGTALALGYDSTLAIHYVTANSTAGDRRVWITQVQQAGDTNGYVWGRFQSSAVSPAVASR